MSYETETKNAYKNKTKAAAYKKQYTEGGRWARFTMWRQKQLTAKLLDICNLTSDDKVLDIPCGAGLIGPVLARYEASVTASDISGEMMNLAENEYDKEKFDGFVEADITKTSFTSDYFKCVIVLSLMHRLHEKLRKEVLTEVTRLTNSYLIISYSEINFFQRLKQTILKILKPSHLPAPQSIAMKVMLDEMAEEGLEVVKIKRIFFLLSSKVLFLVRKTSGN